MHSAHVGLGPGREFDLVRQMLERWGALASGIGDDAAIVDLPPGERLVVSTDSSVENVHFRRAWLSPTQIAYRATMAALSDLAAMAATPRGLLVAFTIPDRWIGEVGGLADGVGGAASDAGTLILGGDIARGEALGITITVLGSTATPLCRDAVRPGDLIYVTGVLGGPTSALRGLQRGETPAPAHLERFARPRARLKEGIWLAQHGAHALIDISDGLAAELRHLTVASALEILIDTDRIPVMRGCSLPDAAGGGEEYELVVAVPHKLDVNDFARAFATPLSEIGEAREAEIPGLVAFRGDRGVHVDLGGGHDHFRT